MYINVTNVEFLVSENMNIYICFFILFFNDAVTKMKIDTEASQDLVVVFLLGWGIFRFFFCAPVSLQLSLLQKLGTPCHAISGICNDLS